MEKTDAFYWLKSDRSTFQIFCSRSLRQYRINYKFHVSVRLLPIKISQWAHEDSAVIVKMLIDEKITRWLSRRNARVSRNQGKMAPWIAPSTACAWFENKRFDWPSLSFCVATFLSINLISIFCTQFQLSELISSFSTQKISSFCTVWD